MSEVRISNELLYEVLKSIQAQTSTIRDDVDIIKVRTSTIERKLGDIQSDLGVHSERMDRMEFQIRYLQNHINKIDAFSDQDSVQ